MNRVIFLGSVALAFVAGAAPRACCRRPSRPTRSPPQVIHVPDLAGDALGMPSGTGLRSKTFVSADGMTLAVQVGKVPKHIHPDGHEIQDILEAPARSGSAVKAGQARRSRRDARGRMAARQPESGGSPDQGPSPRGRRRRRKSSTQMLPGAGAWSEGRTVFGGGRRSMVTISHDRSPPPARSPSRCRRIGRGRLFHQPHPHAVDAARRLPEERTRLRRVCTIELDSRYAAALVGVATCTHSSCSISWTGAARSRGAGAAPWRTARHLRAALAGPAEPDRDERGAAPARRRHEAHCHRLDCLDGTPLIDIKPYFASVDSVPDAVVGWSKGGKE